MSQERIVSGQAMRRRPAVIFKTPLGWAGVLASEQGIRRIILPRKNKSLVQRALRVEARGLTGTNRVVFLDKAVHALRHYFSGERVSFDLPLDLRYYTQFQKDVWKATTRISHGRTRSYGWVAKQIGRPRAMRAVGQALGANPLPIMIPCHRVIGATGSLRGFSDGLTMKKKLLDLELGKGKGT